MSKQKEPKKRRRARGTGTFRFDARRNLWVGRLPIGRNANGTTRYVERSDPTQRGLVEKLKAAGPPGPNVTVGEWVTRWLGDLGVRAGTEDTYRHSMTNYVVPSLGHLRMADLNPHQIESAARKWGDSLGVNTVRLTIAHLSICLNAAVRAGLLDRNPVARSRRPPGEKKKIDPFPLAELLRITEASSTAWNLRIIALLATTGCRSGEAIALDVGDWDAATGCISITKTQSPRGRGAGPPKSRNSLRTIRVPLAAVPILVGSIGKRKRGPLFTTATGNRTDRVNVARAFWSLLNRLGLRQRNLHQLRHSVATAMIASGDPIGDVAKYLGDTPDTIVKTYLHPTGVDPSLTLDRMFSQAKG